MEITRLRVGDEAFLVSSLIDRCPKAMMLRELVQNALESAAQCVAGRVEIAPVTIEGVRKLSIWNTGPGMDAEALYRMCDLASSIGKAHGLDQNFGMGAKVASLPANTHGIRYRSCTAGRVHQVIMGKRGGVYGRVRQPGADGALTDVPDVTAAVVAEGGTLAADWTEVVLLGQRPDQDTVADPYDGSPKVRLGWIAEALYGRFHRLPPTVTLNLHESCHAGLGIVPFRPIAARTAAFTRYETVAVERGIVLHYIYEADDPEEGGHLLPATGVRQLARGVAALIYRGEIYDLRPEAARLSEAPVYGIPFGARNLSVLVQLPDDFPLVADVYRQFLRHAQQGQRQIETRQFAPLVLRHRPAWLIELVESLAPTASHVGAVEAEMQTLLRSLGVRRRWWPATPPAPGPALAPPGPDGEPAVICEVAPEIVALRQQADIAGHGLLGRAAKFYPETHQLFVNTDYEAFAALRLLLEDAHIVAGDAELVREAAMNVAETILVRQICRRLVFGLAKRGDWQAWEVDQAISPHGLTLAVDDHAGLVPEANREMAATLARMSEATASTRPQTLEQV